MHPFGRLINCFAEFLERLKLLLASFPDFNVHPERELKHCPENDTVELVITPNGHHTGVPFKLMARSEVRIARIPLSSTALTSCISFPPLSGTGAWYLAN